MSADVPASALPASAPTAAAPEPDHYCVVGNPVAHSRSPWIHARFADATGEALRYDAKLIALDGLAEFLDALVGAGTRGCNVTVPFKFPAAGLCHRLTDRARIAGAANTLRFEHGEIHGDNTDGAGLVADIERNAGVPLMGRDVLLVGAGGAAAGVLGPLLAARPARLIVTNRTHMRAVQLAASHQALALLSETELIAQALPALEGDFDVIVNATASSLAGGGPPFPAQALRPGALVLDMMYGPAARPFLDWARMHGGVPRDGLGMLVEQAAEAFLFWRGVRPPSQEVLAALRTAIDTPA